MVWCGYFKRQDNKKIKDILYLVTVPRVYWCQDALFWYNQERIIILSWYNQISLGSQVQDKHRITLASCETAYLPLSPHWHFSHLGLMLAWGRGRWAVSQKPKLNPKRDGHIWPRYCCCHFLWISVRHTQWPLWDGQLVLALGTFPLKQRDKTYYPKTQECLA